MKPMKNSNYSFFIFVISPLAKGVSLCTLTILNWVSEVHILDILSCLLAYLKMFRWTGGESKPKSSISYAIHNEQCNIFSGAHLQTKAA